MNGTNEVVRRKLRNKVKGRIRKDVRSGVLSDSDDNAPSCPRPIAQFVHPWRIPRRTFRSNAVFKRRVIRWVLRLPGPCRFITENAHENS